MLGAVIGDIVGSIYEFNNIRTKDFLLFTTRNYFTDDTVMTFAVWEALKKCNGNYKNLQKYTIQKMQEYGKRYPRAGYGANFHCWLKSENPMPYGSYGNGSAMRVSAVAEFAKNLEEVKKLSYDVTAVTHNHEEGIKGAEATAVAIYMAKNKKSKQEIKEYIEQNYYSLNFDYETLRQTYTFNELCQTTVPQAIYCFLISTSFEDAVRCAISIGGDSDTLCAITSSIAEVFYGIPKEIEDQALMYLDDYLKEKYSELKRN